LHQKTFPLAVKIAAQEDNKHRSSDVAVHIKVPPTEGSSLTLVKFSLSFSAIAKKKLEKKIDLP
jgi:hypothetical protein